MNNHPEGITPLDSWINLKISSDKNIHKRGGLYGYQLNKIRETIRLVREKSIFYRNHLKDYSELDISSIEDLADLPFTAASDIRDNSIKMLCVSQDRINRVVTLDSSGTTGTPKRIYFTAEDQELTVDFFVHGMLTLTMPGDRVMILLPCERPGSVGDLLASAIERIGAIPVRHGAVKNIKETLDELDRTKANVLVGNPVQILALARFYELNCENNPSIERVLLSTDYASDAVKTELQRIFRCRVFDHYGMTEMGLGGGIDCSAHEGYHLREADLFFEIVDPHSGKTVSEGEYGEVVFTTLTRDGMPLIRYRTGDISRFISGDCPCGSDLRRMDYIKYRNDSVVLLGDGQRLDISDLDETLLKIDGVVDFESACISKGSAASLIIKIISLNDSLSQSEVLNGLNRIQSVLKASQNGAVEIIIEIVYCTPDYVPGTGKRKIYRQTVD